MTMHTLPISALNATPHTAPKAALKAALATALVAGLAATVPAWAASTSSVTSSASSASVGSSSDSLGTSSDSSSKTDKQVAEGLHTVVAMAELPDQPDRVQLRLRAIATNTTTAATGDAPAEWLLTLPRETVARAQLGNGQQVLVQHRVYGLALSTPTEQHAPFYLVLDDTWHRELSNHAVGS